MKRDDAISRLRAHEADLERLGVERLYLFGSTARGEATDDSDVDLFFDHEKGKVGLFELMDVKELAASGGHLAEGAELANPFQIDGRIGLIVSTPEKSFVLSVTMSQPLINAIAAISMSKASRGRPLERPSAMSRDHASAAECVEWQYAASEKRQRTLASGEPRFSAERLLPLGFSRIPR